MGNMLTMRPDLWGAIVSQVPLLDMRRYNVLLAGASWMGEYGNPDDPKEWAFIQGFSPYHNLKDGVKYPPTLFMTSTRDDRVHPGHARKMTALMLDEEAGRPLLREHRGRPRRRRQQQAVRPHERAGLHVPLAEAEVGAFSPQGPARRQKPVIPRSFGRVGSTRDPQSRRIPLARRLSVRLGAAPPARPVGVPRVTAGYCRASRIAPSSAAFSWKLTSCFTTVPFRSTKNSVGKTLTVP